MKHAMRWPAHTTDVDGLEIRYAEADTGGHDLTILLTSPWPESIYAFEHIWSDLADRARVVAVDLPGFGGSTGRRDLLVPENMSVFLARLIEQWGLTGCHLVAPDVGTSAALFLAARHPRLVSSLVVGNGGAVIPLQVGGALADFVAAPDLTAYEDLDAAELIGGVVDAIPGRPASPQARADYLRSYADGRFLESMRYVRTYPENLGTLAPLLPGIATPVRLVTGADDPLVLPANAEHLERVLPHNKLSVLDAGHFLWEEVPDDYTSVVLDWVTGGFRNV